MRIRVIEDPKVDNYALPRVLTGADGASTALDVFLDYGSGGLPSFGPATRRFMGAQKPTV